MFQKACTRSMMFHNYKMITLVGYMKAIKKHKDIMNTWTAQCKTLIEKYEMTDEFVMKMKLFKNFIRHYQLFRIQKRL